MNTRVVLNEYQEQVLLVEWLELNHYKFTSIPNDTWTPSHNQRRKNYAKGLRPGLPDLLIVIPEKGLLFIELKRTKGGKVSKYQQEWIDELNKIDGVEAAVCKGFEEAKNYILNF